jgi:hypothetical protein
VTSGRDAVLHYPWRPSRGAWPASAKPGSFGQQKMFKEIIKKVLLLKNDYAI